MIAIDGPAGAGKSTVARAVAAALGYTYIDTGAMYRAVAVAALENGVSADDAAAVSGLARQIDVRLRGGGRPRLLLAGRDVTDRLRTPEVEVIVSTVAAHPAVRERLVALQRKLAARGGVVLDGRDTGTHVVPDADCKVFLTASVEERARRRLRQLEREGYRLNVEEVEEEIRRRDAMDSGREVAPLRPAPDALVVDTTGMTVSGVVQLILDRCRQLGARRRVRSAAARSNPDDAAPGDLDDQG
ncbi:MAG: (d)CMP kinase [Bacillota bacterium]|nr:(d)CMP kinase [Bacillota bacterium]